MMPSLFLIAKPAELFIAEIRVQFLPGLHVDFSLSFLLTIPGTSVSLLWNKVK